jgi:Trk-type K+ transport system membrane component
LVALTDLGTFVKSAFIEIYNRVKKCCYRRKKARIGDVEKQKKDKSNTTAWKTVAEFTSIIVIFIFFILLGAFVLPWWEEHLSIFDAVYYTFISISTIGLGDIGMNLR